MADKPGQPGSPPPPSMRNPILLLCLVPLFLGAGGSFAWEVTNQVVIEHGALVIDHSRSVAEITRAQARGGFPAQQGLGLFQNRMKTELVIHQPESVGKVKRLAITTLIRTSPVIHVAREFPEDSCAYGVILGHEQLHQLLDREVLRGLPAEIQAMTRDVFSVDELERAGTRNLERARRHFFQQFKFLYDGLSGIRHQAIDNPESYRRLGELCNGEIVRLLAGR
jgi:hypothetical protein